MKGKCARNKFELLADDIFYIIFQPIEIYLDEDTSQPLVLEIASKISDDNQSKIGLKNEVYKLMEGAQSMIYRDPLTKVYNRRYMNEMLFLYHGQNHMAERMAFIMLDIYQFKRINDLYGHLTGDDVLTGVAETLQQQIRTSDSLIRYGGDEFIIVLTNCEEEQVQLSIERFRRAIFQVLYGSNKRLHIEADFGYSYLAQGRMDQLQLNQMIRTADERMYANKKQHVS